LRVTRKHKLEENTAPGFYSKKLMSVKKAISDIKQSIREFSLSEGFYVQMISQCSALKQGKHHLYDDLDKKKEPLLPTQDIDKDFEAWINIHFSI